MSSKFKPQMPRFSGNNYTEHDDRDRKVHFNPSQKRGRGRFQYNKRRGGSGYVQKRGSYNRNYAGPRSRLDDDDIDMGGDEGAHQQSRPTSRYSPYQSHRGRSSSARGRGGPRPKLINDQVQRPSSSRNGLPDSDWYKVQIPHGKKAEKDFILKSIMEQIHSSFVPYQYHFEQNSAVFYLNDKNTATEIRGVSRRITAPNGFKLVILVRPSEAPITQLSPETKDKLKVCMSNRYDPSTRCLNLDDLYHDDAMKKDGIFFALSRYNVMTEVLKIIKEHIPELLGLKMNGNKLYNLTGLKTLAESAPNIEVLELGKNQLKSEMELSNVIKLNLTTIVLDGNPLCDKFKDEASYISAIRKKFPKLVTLDGHKLPPPITFDIEAPTSLPPTQGSNFGNDQAKDLVCRFLEEYYKIYDSDDRQSLLNAYHENAIFSLCCSFNKLVVGNQPKFTEYMSESRNLTKVTDSYKRQKQLKTGRLNVVALLNQLPKSQHDHSTIVVDITHTSAALASFTISGVFKERSDSSGRPPFRAFTRTFVTAPQGSGCVIVNEQLYITNATPDQVKKSFKTPSVVTASASSPQSPVATATAGPSTSTDNVAIRVEMVRQFSLQSGMNEAWSEKCLSQNNWDYDKSAQAFMDLKANGKIPPEAFVKT